MSHLAPVLFILRACQNSYFGGFLWLTRLSYQRTIKDETKFIFSIRIGWNWWSRPNWKFIASKLLEYAITNLLQIKISILPYYLKWENPIVEFWIFIQTSCEFSSALLSAWEIWCTVVRIFSLSSSWSRSAVFWANLSGCHVSCWRKMCFR